MVALLILGIFALLNHRGLAYPDVGMSYENVIDQGEVWRCVTSQFSHVELLHLIFNLSALWSIGIAERAVGHLYYIKQTSLLLLLSPIICLLLYHAAIQLAHREEYRSVTALGYSCVLFGWMTVLAVRQPAGITMLPIFGITSLPMWLTPFGSLIFTSLIIPRASFVGHLAGILAGYIISLPIFDFVPYWIPCIAALAGFIYAGVIIVKANPGITILGAGLHLPPWLSVFTTGSQESSMDPEGGIRGRLLGRSNGN